MRAVRLFALLLIGVGLFIQGTAYAAAQPAAPEMPAPPCAESMPSEQAPANDQRDGCCGDMQLKCLVSMNCIAPLFTPGADVNAVPAQIDEKSYSLLVAARTAAFVPGPEPPPPQHRS
jgi:hypothetical protein